jgi:hypothetical protein
MDAVTELVGESADICKLIHVAHEDDGVSVGGVVAAERSTSFSGSGFGINPVFLEEFFGSGLDFGMEFAKRFEDYSLASL